MVVPKITLFQIQRKHQRENLIPSWFLFVDRISVFISITLPCVLTYFAVRFIRDSKIRINDEILVQEAFYLFTWEFWFLPDNSTFCLDRAGAAVGTDPLSRFVL